METHFETWIQSRFGASVPAGAFMGLNFPNTVSREFDAS